MSGLFSNPEFIRHTRSQLRPNKLISAASISFLLSFAVGSFIVRQRHLAGTSLQGAGVDLLHTAFILQALILAGGGGIACLNSIFSEKQQNTFDFQRVTRLTSLELTIGKLFGAPLLMYFLCLCLTPLTLYGAALAEVEITHLVAAYAVLLVASIAYHSFTLLLSLLSVRGSQIASILLALLVLWFASVNMWSPFVRLHALGPFDASEVALSHTWEVSRLDTVKTWDYGTPGFTDLFWHRPVHHLPVLLIVDGCLIFWFLLGVVRNIKKDPEYYELYSPAQFLGLAVFLNLLLASFFETRWATPLDAQSVFLVFNIVILSLLGIALLRTRERMRSLVRGARNRVPVSLAAIWPAPFLGLAAVLAGLLIVGCLHYAHTPGSAWSPEFALLRSLFFVIWILRDIQFLQFMDLRPSKHPLAMAFLYLSIYYVCVSFFLTAAGSFRTPQGTPITSIFLPTPVFVLDAKAWALAPDVWTIGFAVQLILLALFFYLQSERIRELRGPATALPNA